MYFDANAGTFIEVEITFIQGFTRRMRCPKHELMFRRNMRETWGKHEGNMRDTWGKHEGKWPPVRSCFIWNMSGTWSNMTLETTGKREVMFHWQTWACTDGTWTRNMRRHILIIRLNMNTEHELMRTHHHAKHEHGTWAGIQHETRGHVALQEHDHEQAEHDHGTWAGIYSSEG